MLSLRTAEILRDDQRAAGQHAKHCCLDWRGSDRTSERRSRRSAVARHVRPGLPSAHSLCRVACHGGHRGPAPIHCGRLPWLASRGWSRVGARLPCPDVESVEPFYDGSGGLHRCCAARIGDLYRSRRFYSPGGSPAGAATRLRVAPCGRSRTPLNDSTGHPRAVAMRRSARSGFTARG